MHINTLVELAIQRSLRGSLRGLAEQMGISSGVLSQWKLGNKPIPDERIQQLAKIAGQDAGPWLLLIHSEQDQGELGREWAKLYKQLAGAAMALLICIGTALPDHAKASQIQTFKHAPNDTLCEIGRMAADGETATPLAVAVADLVATITHTQRQGNRSMSDTYDIDRRPPCWEPGQPCPNHCAQAHARHVLDNHVELHGPWAGWRLAGRDLVAPSGERIPERRLRGLLWRADAIDLRDSARARNKARKARQQAMVKVVVVDLATWRDRHFGRMAG
ncbi:hypothetical protein XalbCFBP2523_14775 [Xanthomonas albilineans]|nr:hypothetical protein XalbCFBP2523_14775 [Xanthomonas albilineans]